MEERTRVHEDEANRRYAEKQAKLAADASPAESPPNQEKISTPGDNHDAGNAAAAP